MPLIGGVEGPRTYKGHDGVREWMREVEAAWAEYRVAFGRPEVVSSGVAVVDYEFKLRGRGSGAEVEYASHGVIVIDSLGLAHRWGFFATRAEAVEQAREWAEPQPA